MLPLMKLLGRRSRHRQIENRHKQRGQILPLVALGVLALFGMATLAIDVGFYRYQQRLEQSAADAAALAGGIQLIYSSANVAAAGKAASAQNGFTDDAGVTTSVTINNPPATGPNTGNARAVEAIVTKKQPLFFGGVFGGTYQSITARAVALPNTTTTSCLNTQSTSNGITMHGSGSVIVAPGCGILSNDNIDISGNGSITASYVGYVSGSAPACTGCLEPPGPIQPIADPCIAFTGCAYLYNNGPPAMTSYATATWTTGQMPAGEYTSAGGVTIKGGTLNGFYQFDHGVTITGSVTGTNLTIYNRGNPISINLAGSGTTSLVAPTSGNYNNLLIYQPASLTGNITLNGAANSDAWTGLVYLPGASMTTNGSEPTFTALILGDMTNDGHNITLTGAGVTTTTTNHYVLAE